MHYRNISSTAMPWYHKSGLMQTRKSRSRRLRDTPIKERMKEYALTILRAFAYFLFAILLFYVLYNFWCMLIDKKAYPFN